eukprot:2640255-Prorocentrum_lima.AAC.1
MQVFPLLSIELFVRTELPKYVISHHSLRPGLSVEPHECSDNIKEVLATISHHISSIMAGWP